MEIERKKNFIINFIYGLMIFGILFVLFRYAVPLIMPFLTGFLIAFLLRRPIAFLSKRCRIKRSIMAVIAVIIFYAGFIVLFSLLGVRIFISAKNLVFILPDLYQDQLQPVLMDLLNWIEKWFSQLDASLLATLDEMSGNLLRSAGEAVSGISVWAIGIVSNWASTLPGMLIRILFAVISTFFFSVDYQKITGFLMRQLKERQRTLLIETKDYLIHTVFKCIASYLLIMFITFLELSVGLTVIGVEKSVLIAFLIAIFDILPVLGTGGIMIPWTLITLIQGNYPLVLGLLCLYLFVTVVRNIIEPKIVGSQMGLHPLVTLMAMFVGTQLFGILGLFGFPIALSLLKNLNDKGTIHLWK